MYADYEFYVNVFYGDKINQADFPKWAERASERLNYATMGRITKEALARYENGVKRAMCAVAEVLYDLDLATKNAGTNIASRSSGGESISYAFKDTTITAVLSDKNAQEKLIFDTIRIYLGGSGLLYQGV